MNHKLQIINHKPLTMNHKPFKFCDPNPEASVLNSTSWWEGSTTVAHTVVWRNSVVWCTGGNTALWLVEKRICYVCPVWNFQVVGYLKPITALYFTPYTKPHNFAKRQYEYERQWLTPPTLDLELCRGAGCSSGEAPRPWRPGWPLVP